jgi:hypothetical protein
VAHDPGDAGGGDPEAWACRAGGVDLSPPYEIFGITRYWRYSQGRIEQLIAEGSVCQDKPGTMPYRKHYLDESPGVPLQDIWADITMLRGRQWRAHRLPDAERSRWNSSDA